MQTLFDPLRIGDLHLPNRIIMAPLTRLRAPGPGAVPNRLMAEYYAQRASAGLIISEGVPVSQDAVGYPNVPGLWTAEQVHGWRLVTDAVHKAGGRIFTQLWHVGRISDPEHLQGRLPVAPSPIAAAKCRTCTSCGATTQITEHCRANLTAYKVPRHISFVDTLPKSPVGKILRRELRTEAKPVPAVS